MKLITFKNVLIIFCLASAYGINHGWAMIEDALSTDHAPKGVTTFFNQPSDEERQQELMNDLPSNVAPNQTVQDEHIIDADTTSSTLSENSKEVPWYARLFGAKGSTFKKEETTNCSLKANKSSLSDNAAPSKNNISLGYETPDLPNNNEDLDQSSNPTIANELPISIVHDADVIEPFMPTQNNTELAIPAEDVNGIAESSMSTQNNHENSQLTVHGIAPIANSTPHQQQTDEMGRTGFFQSNIMIASTAFIAVAAATGTIILTHYMKRH